jgi:YfiH family protein
VTINRARVAEAFGLASAALISMNQVHSATVMTLTGVPAERLQADGMVTAVPELGLAVLTADCQPVLFADATARVIGAAHAGWRGARNGVLEATLDAMEALGAHRANISAVIGPTISQAAYEVGPEFHADFVDDDPLNAVFFVAGVDDRMHFDLPGYGLHRLRQAGVGHAEWTGHCTYRDPERFYSFRRATHNGEADYGRLVSVIRL